MDFTRRLLLNVLLAALTVRAILFLIYLAQGATFPIDTAPFESKMALLVWRVMHGLSLYPEWRDYPHVNNFFAPVYFVLVGGLGRLAEAGIRELFWIGRGLTVASTLLTAAILWRWITVRDGRWAGIAGALGSMGSLATYNVTILVRPDTMADMMGLVGFVLGISPSRLRRALGIASLIVAILTKQTAVAFAAATVLALVVQGRRRQALTVLAAVVAGVLAVIVTVTATLEPLFARSLVGEAETPWDLAAWVELQSKMVRASPDAIFLPLVACVLALRQTPRDWTQPVLSGVLLLSSIVLSAKLGAAPNYFLSLHIAEALAIGTIWRQTGGAVPEVQLGRTMLLLLAALVVLVTGALLMRPPGAPPAPDGFNLRLCGLVGVAVAVVVLWRALMDAGQLARAGLLLLTVLVVLIPSELLGLIQNLHVSQQWSGLHGAGAMKFHDYEQSWKLASRPNMHILSDWETIDLYQGERAVLSDPWQYKWMVESGRFSPAAVETRLRDHVYDLVISRNDLESATYEKVDIRLPMPVVAAVRKYYHLKMITPGFYIYEPRAPGPARGGLAPDSPGAPGAGPR